MCVCVCTPCNIYISQIVFFNSHTHKYHKHDSNYKIIALKRKKEWVSEWVNGRDRKNSSYFAHSTEKFTEFQMFDYFNFYCSYHTYNWIITFFLLLKIEVVPNMHDIVAHTNAHIPYTAQHKLLKIMKMKLVVFVFFSLDCAHPQYS